MGEEERDEADANSLSFLMWKSLVINLHVVKLASLVKSYLAADIRLECTNEIMASNIAVSLVCTKTCLQSEIIFFADLQSNILVL